MSIDQKIVVFSVVVALLATGVHLMLRRPTHKSRKRLCDCDKADL